MRVNKEVAVQRNHVSYCLLGLGAGVMLVLAFGVQLGSLVYLAAVLACPLMMLLMMRGMGGHGRSDHHPGGEVEQTDRQPTR